jgi:hypothetical protein
MEVVAVAARRIPEDQRCLAAVVCLRTLSFMDFETRLDADALKADVLKTL